MNTKYFLIILLLLLIKNPVQSFSKTATVEIKAGKNDCSFKYDAGLKKKIYNTVDVQAEFPGGTAEMYKYIVKGAALTNEDYEKFGRLEVKFLIGPNGRATFFGFGNKNIDSVKYLENRVRKAFEKMPRWSPGKCKGENVSVQYSMMLQS